MDTWLLHVKNPNEPMWLRIVALAFGKQHKNGHVSLAQGEIEELLTLPGKTPPLAANVNREIKKAINNGYLHPSSVRRCLVVPEHVATGGVLGRERDECRHHTPRPVPRKSRKFRPKPKPTRKSTPWPEKTLEATGTFRCD